VNILLVTQYFWPEDFRINDLALGLLERGHHVTVLTGKPNYPSGKFFPGYGFLRRAHDDYRGIEVVRVPLIPRGGGSGLHLAANYLSFAAFACLAGPFLCRGPYDAILAYEPSPITVGIPARLLRFLTRAPLLFWVQDLWPQSLVATGAVKSRCIIGLAARLTRFVYRGCDAILVQSRGFVQPILELGIRNRRIEYFPNTAEALYQPLELPLDAPERARLPGGFRIMFAGNIGVAQDFETILAAAELLKDEAAIHWIILGEGRMTQWVRAEVSRRGLSERVHLLGRHPLESMPRWFAAADAMLVTLKREPIFAYTIPTKIQSYMACARPIIAALDGEGARVVTESGAGYAVPAQQPRALAEAVRTLGQLSEPERTAMGLAGRRYFREHFERGRLLDQLEAWMRELRGANLGRRLRRGPIRCPMKK
jgi:colanic acid biosynthesis glycosyl transferase WcaI